MARIAGTLQITQNGNTIEIAGEGIDYDLGNPKSETMSGPTNANQGQKEIPKPPYISGTARVGQGFSVNDFTLIRDATVTAVLANGTEVSVFEAHYEEEGVANSGNAELPFKFVGRKAVEITA